MRDTITRQLRIAVLLAIVAVTASGQDVVSARGFHAGEIHQYNGFDSVNQFTGNLGVTVPLGQTFKTNGSLQYAFTLQYNSQLWNLKNWGSGTNQDPAGGTHGSWRGEGEMMEAYPASTFNAGLGWQFGVSGRLAGRDGRVVTVPDASLPAYIDAAGGEHGFSVALHPQGSTTTPATTVGFSNDSAYYRMRKIGSYYIVDRPDGIQERFKCVTACSTEHAVFDLDQMSDAYGHVLYVARGTEPSANGGLWSWTYFEAVGNEPYPDHTTAALTTLRAHGATFKKTGDPYSPYRVVTLALASSADGDAVYFFTYDENAAVIRPHANTYGGRDMVYPINGATAPDNRIKTWLLKTVTLPSMADSEGGSWALDYLIVPGAPDYPNGVTLLTWTTSSGDTISWETSHYSGLLRSLTLPTGGKVEYKYGTRGFSKRFCDTSLPSTRGNFGYIGVGVRQRQIVKANGQNDGRPWLYHGQAYNHLPGSCQIREFIGTTIDPLGNATSTFFSVYFDGDNPDGSWKRAEYGLPVSKFESSGGLHLSTRVMQCELSQLGDFENSSTASSAFRRMHPRWLQPGEALSCGKISGGAVVENKIRSTYRQWEYLPGSCPQLSPNCGRYNERIKAERVVYHDDGDAFTDTTYSEFDGLGHYRTMKTGGDFFARNFPNGTGGDERITIKNYNPGFVFTGTGFSATDNKDLTTMPWLLGLYDLTVMSQATNGQAGGANVKSASVLYRFNATTGFLERKRVALKPVACGRDSVSRAQCFNSTVLDGSDLLFDYTRTREGDTVKVVERAFGGDGAGLPANDLSVAPAGDPSYIRESVYKSGTLQKLSHLGCTGTLILREEDNDVDSETGLVKKSRDSAGAETLYTYDHLGRYLMIDPPGTDAPTFYRYFTATASSRARVVIETRQGSTVLRDSEVLYDHLGRVAIEREKFATGTTAASWSWAYRAYEYHPNNWKISESTMGPEGAGGAASPLAARGKTEYSDYDAFGRARRIDLPDRNGRYIVKSFSGDRAVVETRHGVEIKGDTKATVSSKYDRFGNLVALTEEALYGPDDEARTVYEYDVLDNLTKVLSPNSQTRTMNYDMRGFLTSETHPELDSRGIRYQDYDPRGLPGKKLYSLDNEPKSPHDLQYIYDGAGRLTDVRELAAARSLKAFNYYPMTGAMPPMSAGKLRSSVRDNWVPVPAELQKPRVNMPVTQEYRYDGSTGRMSGKTTSAGGWVYDVAWTHNALGKTASITYPQLKTCKNCATPLAGPPRTVTMEYVQGMLVRMPGYAPSITYHASGAVKQVVHRNWPGDGTKDTRDVYGEDPHSLPRATSITSVFTNASSWFMDLDYDAAGNVTIAGAQTYRYDKVNRLVEANVSGVLQTYTYDANGNLTNFNGTPLSIAQATNRLPSPATYDRAGNVLTWTDPRRATLNARFEWDAASMLIHHSDPRQGKIFLYDANDERIATIDYVSANPEIVETWVARGPNDEVLRDFVHRRTKDHVTRSWTWRDAIHRGTVLHAEAWGSGVNSDTEMRQVHVDHLGSVRRVSNRDGVVVEQRELQPFGQEIGEKASGTRIRFAGHERDDNGALDPFGDLDYMHARYYAMMLGRFLSVDPIEGTPGEPQSWNRYTYSRNNPATLFDPDGNSAQGAWTQTFGDPGWVDDNRQCVSPTEAAEREAKRESQIRDYLEFRRQAPLLPQNPPDGWIGPAWEPPHAEDGHDDHGEGHGGGHGGGHDPHPTRGQRRLHGEGSDEDWEKHRDRDRLDDPRRRRDQERRDDRDRIRRGNRDRFPKPWPPRPIPRIRPVRIAR